MLARFVLGPAAVVVERDGEIQRGWFIGGSEDVRCLRDLGTEVAREIEELIETQVAADACEKVRGKAEVIHHVALAEAFPQRSGVVFLEQIDRFG